MEGRVVLMRGVDPIQETCSSSVSLERSMPWIERDFEVVKSLRWPSNRRAVLTRPLASSQSGRERQTCIVSQKQFGKARHQR